MGDNVSWRIIGLMSGSSLDGLDIAVVEFVVDSAGTILFWQIRETDCMPIPDELKLTLTNLPAASAREFVAANASLGHWIGLEVANFIEAFSIQADAIASHGHTIFHDPAARYTSQIGDPSAIAAVTGLPVIADFRAMDIALGGQGAPFAPLVDQLLFTGYDFYLNLGGIANLTALSRDRVIAYDIAPANQIFNHLAKKLNQEFDQHGKIASVGSIQPPLYQEWLALDYFAANAPKSLDNNWIKEVFVPIADNSPFAIADQMRTAVSFLVEQLFHNLQLLIKAEFAHQRAINLLATGGGTFNRFLMRELKWRCLDIAGLEIVIPKDEVISFKEAALMALLGLRRIYELPTSFASVTGARFDPVGGGIYPGWKKPLKAIR